VKATNSVELPVFNQLTPEEIRVYVNHQAKSLVNSAKKKPSK